MKRQKKLLLSALSLAALTTISVGSAVASADTAKADPTVNMINGVMGVLDKATYGDNGNVELNLLASTGYGTRALFANLGEYNKLNVKDCSCEIAFDVAVNISTMISLQTDETGTVGAGNGNGVHVLFRNEYDGFMTVAVYDQAATTTYYATELGAFELNEDKTVTVAFSENEGEYAITVTSGENTLNIVGESLNECFESTYAQYNYKGYLNISSYYMAQVESAEAKYSINKVNGMTAVEWEKSILSSAIKQYEDAVALLNEESSQEEIALAVEKNVFDEEIWSDTLLAVDDGSLQDRIDAADAAIGQYSNKLDYEKISAAIDAFKTSLGGYDKDNQALVLDARAKYAAIDMEKINTIGAPYEDTLKSELSEVKAMPTYKTFIGVETENYVVMKEAGVKDGDAKDLKTYKEMDTLVSEWQKYVQDNGVAEVLGQDAVNAYEARIQAIVAVKENSFYENFWTEGDTWNAELVDGEGLYASGAGLYHETLGFNQKLELGKNTEITFNVIYALKRLGANHLHIGFYPKTNSGTLGDAEGVRVDFWFAGSSIEVKAVNGKTEEDVYDTAYITVEDMGFYDPEEGDTDVGKYTVKLYTYGDALVVSVNGMEMDIVGITPDLYADGCYMTVSAISVRGADYNEIMITKLGDVDYTNYAEQQPATDDSDEKEAGCGSRIHGEVVGCVAIVAALAFVVLRKWSGKENV